MVARDTSRLAITAGFKPKRRQPQGDQSPPTTPTDAPGGIQIKFGASVESDPRLLSIRAREAFLLNVVIPRHRTWRDAAIDWLHRSLKPDVYIPLLLIIVLHAGTGAFCSIWQGDDEGSGICSGGPTGEDGQPLPYLTFGEDYGPPILNSLATLMLSFYANTCLAHFRDAYLSCQQLKASINVRVFQG